MRRSLDTFDIIPEPMRQYLRNFGYHFNKKAYQWAVKQMGVKEPYTQDQIDELLKKHGVTVKNDVLYDKAYVASMAKSDYMGKSLPNEQYLALFVRDYLDDEDGTGEEAFRRWLADCVGRGVMPDFDDFLN